MRIQPKYIQIVGDAVIPLLGLFLWDWSLYFILLFYFLDILVNELIVHLKSRRIVQFYEQKASTKRWILYGFLSAAVLTIAFLMIHFSMRFITPEINFSDELVAFWNYEEMGIKQGYVLLPLVLLVGVQQYRMTFLMVGKYRNLSLSNLWKDHIQALIFTLAFTGIVIGISYFFQLSEMIYVLGIVAVSTVYKLRFSE
jgi:hypothetical protein